MNRKKSVRLAVDCAMTVALLLLMGYSRVGETAHECLGVAMFVLFAAHHVLNRAWLKSLGKGRYSAYRVLQTVLAALIFAGMLGSVCCGILLSKHLFSFFYVPGSAEAARTAHHLCGYWNFVLMSVHLGTHGSMMIAAAKKQSQTAFRIVCGVCVIAAVYGVYAFIRRQLGAYLTGQVMFSFFDYDEPLALFLLDYLAIMAAFALAGYGVFRLLRKERTEKR